MGRRVRLGIGLGAILVASVVILWTTSAESGPKALTVSEAKYRAAELAGADVVVRGTVVEGSIVLDGSRLVEFVVADTLEHLRVTYNGTRPDNFGAKEVLVRGHVVAGESVPEFEAEAIQVGCASKY